MARDLLEPTTMSLLQAIRRFFGFAPAPAVSAKIATGAQAVRAPSIPAPPMSVRSLSSIPPAPVSRPSVRPGEFITATTEESWQRLKAFLRGCDRHGIDLAKLPPNDAVGFWMRRCAIEESLRNGLPLERAAIAVGFQGAEHWKLVARYFEARYSELAAGPDGELRIRFVDEFQRAAKVAQLEREKASQRAAEAKLQEPIQGITLERFAELAAAVATLGENPSRADMSRVLGEFGVGSATFGAARRGWLDRMKEDRSGRLRVRFLDVFHVARNDRASSGVHAKLDIEREASARRSWVADFDLTG